ncbi:MAG: peptidoglycan DD-metalloendopeptidase family protein [Acidobacteria bacterium]|nr:peptidoglycan DD-metalloendopeptidase family protein [Acidobacteriota bacterium]
MLFLFAFVVADLHVGEARTVTLPGGLAIPVQLTSVNELRDAAQQAVREARVSLVVDGKKIELRCGNYELPRAVGRVQVDCPVTAGYMKNSTEDHWGLRAAARIRLWPAGAPWMPPGEMGYPLKQRWFLTHTQMSNEPTYADGGEQRSRKKVYYHSGLDLGGTEAMAQVVAATDGVVVSLGKEVLPEHKSGTPVAPRYDVIYLRDSRGWYYRYSHLYSFDPSIELGANVRKGDALGLLGKEGGSGGWSHLHFEIKNRQPSGEWGTEEGFAFLWEAYLRDFKPDVMAMARPHRYAKVGEEVTLDAGRSWVREGAPSLRWRLSDGRTVTTPKVSVRYAKPGTYSEVLEVKDARGRAGYDFATVNVYGDTDPITINASYFPSLDVKAGQTITFKVRTFGLTSGEETWDFGDGSPRRSTQSDGNAVKLAKDGYAVITHKYEKPGDYIVTVKNRAAATTHLWVPVK